MKHLTRPASPFRFVVLALLAAPAALGAQTAEAPLDEARRKFREGSEAAGREGSRICAAENSPEAVTLLLEVLAWKTTPANWLSEAHFRDVVWEALVSVTDPYARRVVENELKSNKKDELVREWCARLIGVWGDADLAEPVARALSDKELGVRREAARALGFLRFEPAAVRLGRLTGHRDIYLRGNAIESLARIDAVKYGGDFEDGLADKDGGVRCALLGAVPELYPARVEELSIPTLAKDADWRPRMQAVDNLASVRTKTAVDALIGATEDGRPVVAARAIAALKGLTGMSYTRPAQWRDWWQREREAFGFPSGEAAPPEEGRATSTYHGLPVVSDHAAFLIDKSADMSAHLESKGTSKSAAALAELETVLSRELDQFTFNVWIYNREIEAFGKYPVELTKKSRAAALAFVEKAKEEGPKDIWALLETVVADPTLDTAYLLSSGEPDIGLYVHWNRVTDHLKELNRFHKVVVHAVAYSANEGYRAQVRKIAEATGGEFRWFE